MLETVWNSTFTLSELFGYLLLTIIIGMTYFHFYMNWRWGVRRKGFRSQILFLNYHIKFGLFWGMIHSFPDLLLFVFVSSATALYLIASCVALGAMGLHYNWEFKGGKVKSLALSRERDAQYHFEHDIPAFLGMQAMLWLGWILLP